MSNAALRQRRTVPLTFSSHHKDDDEGDHSVPTEESSLRSGSLSGGSRGSYSGGNAGGVSRARKKKSEVSITTRRIEPIRASLVNGETSGHSRNSSGAPAPKTRSISTSELKRDMAARRKAGERRSSTASDPRTPAGRAHLFSIGSDQDPVALLPTPLLHRGASIASSGSHNNSSRGVGDNMPDLFGIGQALEISGLTNRRSSFSPEKRANSLPHKNSFTVKTPFEVDAPRGEPSRSSRVGRSPSSPSGRDSVASESVLNLHLSEEQDAWAGIDELLETRSLDDSYCFSTSEILPKATVKAMRRERGFLRGVDEDTVWGDEEDEDDEGSDKDDDDSRSDGGESRNSKRSLESLSRTSSTSSSSGRLKGQNTTQKSRKESERSKETKNQDSFNAREERERARQPRSGDAGIFDMFQWSEKDNVDEERTRKGKLNSKSSRKVKVLAPRRDSQHGSDTCSLPSLATIRADDFSVRSGAQSSDWGDTYHSKDVGSVVSENSRDEFGFESVYSSKRSEAGADDSSQSGSTHSRSSFANDGLVLDKSVDEYIRKIQQSLPTISEHGDGSSKKGGKTKKKHVGFAIEEEETSPSPTSVIPEETAFDELPSLSALSGVQFEPKTAPSGRMEEKKGAPKPSLTFLMSSMKKITNKVVKGQKQLGDEEKYFPDEVKAGAQSKKFNDSRCLLSGGDDGVNWDAD